ncbi:helix-turn-helix transcriptional regulator [Arthrobacter sp. SAFR-179]|uniref:helix-turn-helix transcriptional regulator n=1 Tax=Arthrobacter sp. SAFR-179 TaxID=3387279 RepID=UPI003F7C8E9C
MKRAWAMVRSLERIRVLAGSIRDHQALRKAVLTEVGTMVPFDAFVWPLCDPRTTVGMAPRARIPCPQELPALIRLKYLSPPARWTGLMASSVPALSLLHATQGDPARSLLWRGVLNRYDVRDVLSVVFADQHGCWAWLDLWRTGEADDFTEEETTYLAELAAALTPGLRRSVSRQFHAGTTPDVMVGLDLASQKGDSALPGAPSRQDMAPGPGRGRQGLPEQGVLTLSEDLAVVGRTESVNAWLHLLQPGPVPHHQVPAEVLNVGAQLLAREAGVDHHDAESRVHIGSGRWALLRANRIAPAAEGSTPPLAVTIQGCMPSDRLDIFARAFGLTQRQRELLWLAAAGADTGTMADTQGVTPYTVQDQFKQIFQACGVHSRAALMAMALGTGSRG